MDILDKLNLATETLAELLMENICYYDCLPNSHRMSAEEYYSEEIKVVEKIIGKKWQDIMEINNGY